MRLSFRPTFVQALLHFFFLLQNGVQRVASGEDAKAPGRRWSEARSGPYRLVVSSERGRGLEGGTEESMALGSALNQGGGRSRNQRRHPATTPAPQTMSVDLYNHFRPLEQDVPQDHILPFLDFGRKLTTGPPLNSIESSSTTAKADPASASAQREDQDLYHEDMDVAVMRKAVERNTVPRRMVRLKDPVISAYFKKHAKPECESCRRDNNTEPDLQGHESRTKIHKIPPGNSTTPLKIVVTEKPRIDETSGPPRPDPTPKILSTAVVTSVSVQESPRAPASPNEEAGPKTQNTTLELPASPRAGPESKNTTAGLPPGRTTVEIEKSSRKSDDDTTPKLPPDRPNAEPGSGKPDNITLKLLPGEPSRETEPGDRETDDTTEKPSPGKSNAGIEPSGRKPEVSTPESLPARSSGGAEPGSRESENTTAKLPLGSLSSGTDPGSRKPENATLEPSPGRSSAGAERGERENATLKLPQGRSDAKTESPSLLTSGKPENTPGKSPPAPSSVGTERGNPKPQKVGLKLPPTLSSARRENQTHYSSLFDPNKAKSSTTPRPKPTFRPVTFRSAFTRRNFTKIMPPVIRVVSTPHSYIEVPKIVKSLHTQAAPKPASTTTTTSSTTTTTTTTTTAPVTEPTVGTSERPESTSVTEEAETTTSQTRGPAETTTEETATSPRPSAPESGGESEEKGGGLEVTAGPGLLWVYGQRNLSVLEGLQPVGVAYQNTLGAATYILAVLGIVPLLLGAFVLVRQLLKNKKKVLDESEYSSEYNRSPLPTKLPRLPAHLNWENEKPQVVPTLCKRWEFPREKMRLQTLLGQGNFGQVWKAEADDISGHEGQTRLVAVKMVKEGGTEREKEDLLRELGIMQDLGAHPNVVTLLGCCTEKEPYMLIMEYVMYGKLLAFLREHRTRAHYFNFSDLSSALTSRDLTVFAYCVARGMEYLVTKGIIHRDLAARNILVDHNKLCKIADFGMSRNVQDTGQIYEQRPNKGALPIRWMAPESLQFCLFTHKADVWSFGILLWEIITLGSTPYATMGAREVIRRVKEGYRLERPKHCKQELYKVVTKCWSYDPSKRPSFSELRQEIGVLLGDKETHGGFVDLDALAEEVSLQNN